MIAAIEKHSRSIWLAVILLTIGGVVAATQLPVSLFPHIDYPRVVVSVDAGERDGEQMAAEITRPIEIALREVPGVVQLRSTTSRGSADVALGFPWGSDMASATLATQSALATLAPDLPAGTRLAVRRSDPTIFPSLGLALTSKTRDPVALRQIAELKLLPLLTTVPGVAGVDILGGSPREIAVTVDPSRLRALGLTLTDVSQSIAAANTIEAAGRIEDRHKLYLTLIDSKVATIADIAETPIKTGDKASAGIVTLGQVATITASSAPNWTRVTSDGQDAVLVNIRQTPTGDTVAIVKAVEARLASTSLPPGVHVTNFYDQSELVLGAATSVRDAILLGALLAGVVLFIFLRSVRLMLITGFVLPAVLAAACLALKSLGMGFNMMTLGGMAAAVGLVVDDAVVMLEHIMRRMQEGRESRADLLAAAAEMAGPLVGSTLATVIIFLPLAFISGVTGGFFKALAVTMTAALLVSLLYARFVIPLVATRWLTKRDAEAAERAEASIARVNDGYHRAATRILGRPGLSVALTTLVLVIVGGLSWTRIESGFMPKMDEGGFILDYKSVSGSALSDTDHLLRQVETIIRSTPEVASYSRRTGLQLGGGLTEADEGDFFIRLKGGSRRDIEAVMTEVRDRVARDVPGLEIETAQLMEDLIGDLTAVPQPIEVKLFGDDPAALNAGAEKVVAALGHIDGVAEVASGLRVAGDDIAIHIDRAAAALAGLDPAAIAQQLGAQIDGTVATKVRDGELLLDVRVRAPADVRRRVDQFNDLLLRAPDGRTVSLRQVATLSVAAGRAQITREDLAPFIPVTARLDGRDLGSAMKDVKATVAGLGLPASIRVDYGGLYAQQRQSFADLTMVFAAALLLTALLLTLMFERWLFTLAAITTVLLSVAAVFAGLWLTGTELDISALMGLTMVIGMVTELVIFFLAELDRTEPLTTAALAKAGRSRLRPILMSAIIAILALLPLALGIGRGSGLQRPLATAIISGLAIGAPLVLLFLPAVLSLGIRQRPTP